MDSLTHIALGGLIGEALLGKVIGKRAILLGAVAQSIPDVDFMASFWLNTPEDLLAHRGFTHSFLFAILLAPLLAWWSTKCSVLQPVSFKKWTLFFSLQIIIHILLDSLNAYGTGWFEPFSHARISFNVLFVADPFYSLWLAISFFVLIWLGRSNSYRNAWAFAGLSISSIYLVYAMSNKYMIDRNVRKTFRKQMIAPTRYFTTPTPLNNWLWYIVAEDKYGYWIGYRSVFVRKDTLSLTFFARNDSLLVPMRDHDALHKLIRFSQGYYIASQNKDALVFNDLRFGQQAGWYNPNAKFVFQYYLNHPAENDLVIQRGRFTNWNTTTMRSMYEQILGK